MIKDDLQIDSELTDLLFHDKDWDEIRQPLIHKRLRRDANLNPIKCPCTTQNGFREGSLTCPYCYGDGYLFDEVIIEGFLYNFKYLPFVSNMHYSNTPGRNDSRSFTLVTRAKDKVYIMDRIYVPKVNEDNKLAVPLLYTHKYTIYYTNTMKASQSELDFNISMLKD